MRRRRQRVTVTTEYGSYKGFILRMAHELHFFGKPERVYVIETCDGVHYARESWMRRER